DGVTVELVSSVNPSTFGETITLTATVTTASTGGVPTGEVVFRDGETEVGREILDGAGRATLQISSLRGGSHSLRADYAGDADHESGSSTVVEQIVDVAPSSVALTPATGSSVFGEDVTLTA